MEYALIGVVAIVTIVAMAAFSKQLGVAAPLILVLVGLGVSYIPGLPQVDVPPWLILEAVLPPLLYSAAVQVPLVDFRRNFGAISALSVGLVALTTVIVSFILFMILPALDFGAAIALGAVVSPTDAVAATTVARRLGLPPRLITVLEGESLVNDASALVLLKTAIAASGAAVSVWSVAGQFALSVVVAIVIGLIVGVVTVFVRSKLRDSTLDTAISFAVPFIAYIPVEAMGASGVLAVVVAGLYSGHNSTRYFSAQAKISERLNWKTVQFILENGVFLLMGLQLSKIVADVNGIGIGTSIAIGALVVTLLLVIRVVVVVPEILLMRRRRRRANAVGERITLLLQWVRSTAHPAEGKRARQHARARQMLERRSADVTARQHDAIGWRGGVILTWAGMRGVVTVAAAQSLPPSTPYRSQLILIAFTVAIVTLLLQGGTLPWVIRISGVRGSDSAIDREMLATLLDEIGEAGKRVIDTVDQKGAQESDIDEAVVERLRQDMLLRSEAVWERAQRDSSHKSLGPHAQYRIVLGQILKAERQALLEARSRGDYPSRILSQVEVMLDFEESRLANGSSPT